MSPSSIAPSFVSAVTFLPDTHRLLWHFSGSADASGCTGFNLQAAGDDGDYHQPIGVGARSQNTVECIYADHFDPGNSAWFVGAIPAGIVLNGSTFEIPEAGFI